MRATPYRSETGPTTADDPQRLVWYAATCAFWTDDWTKLSRLAMGIPCCPRCGSIGLQATAKEWFDGAARFEADGHPRYQEYLQAMRENCQGRKTPNIKNQLFAYKQWLARKATITRDEHTQLILLLGNAAQLNRQLDQILEQALAITGEQEEDGFTFDAVMNANLPADDLLAKLNLKVEP